MWVRSFPLFLTINYIPGVWPHGIYTPQTIQGGPAAKNRAEILSREAEIFCCGAEFPIG